MSLARLILSGALAVAVTLGLLLLMHFLILQNMTEPEESETFKIPEIVMPEREIKTEYDTKKPQKPEEPEQPPPEMPKPEFDTPDVTADNLNITAPINRKVDITGLGGFSDGSLVPIVKVNPTYPSRAASRGIEGYCTVEYTVTANGTVKDIVVVDADPEGIWDRASIKAAEKFKYKPQVIDGEPVEVRVQNTFFYKMEQ